VVASFLNGGPKNKPGEKHEYWNQGYALLAGIIQTTSGQSYPEFCTEHLFRATGMKSACFTGDQGPKKAQIAMGYSSKGKPRTALEHPYREYGFQYQGMGGAVSNVWDLWRWNQALQKKNLLSSKALKELFKPGPSDYSLGWKISEKDGLLTQSHGGSVRGFVAEIRRYPKKKAFIAVLCNDDAFSPGRVAQILENALLRGEVMDIPTGLTEELQAKLAGVFRSAKGNRLEISAQGIVTSAKLYWAQGYRSFGTMGMNEEGELICFPLFDPVVPKVKYGKDGMATSIDLGYGPYIRQE
jgi:CubicO group peptidase (beta-lactamase class C family)